MAFNPDEYLSKTQSQIPQSGGFNPDVYLGKIVVKKPATDVWSKLGAKVTTDDIARELSTGHPVRAYGYSVAKAGQDMLTVPWSFFNQMAMDYPRQILKKKAGITVPEAEGGLMRNTAKVAGVVGGLKNPLLKTFGGAKAFLAAPLGKKALISGVQAMAYPTSEGVFNLKEKPGQFVGGYALGAALPAAGKGLSVAWNKAKNIPGAPEWLASHISDITDFTKSTIRRLGSKVFDQQYAADSYVGDVFTPKFREHLFSQIENLGLGWKNTAQLAKFKQKEIEALSSMSRDARKGFIEAMRRGMSAQEAADLMISDAGNRMEGVITAHNQPIPINNFINSIKRNLLQEKWAQVDKYGYLVPNKVSPVPHDTRDNLIKVYNFYNQPNYNQAITLGKSSATKRVVAVATAKDWQVMKQDLERLYTNRPQDDRVIANTLRTLVNDAKTVARGIPGYKEAARRWYDAKTLADIAPKLDQWTDPTKINTMFAGINAKNADARYQLMKQVRSSMPGELFDDLAAHYAQRNFDPNFYPSLSGIRKLGVTELSKMFYKKYPTGVTPLQESVQRMGARGAQIREAISPVTRPVGRFVNQAVDYALSPQEFSPETVAGARALMSNRRGSAMVPGFPEKLPKVDKKTVEATIQAIKQDALRRGGSAGKAPFTAGNAERPYVVGSTEIMPSPGLIINKRSPLQTPGLHKISYFGDTGQMAFSTSTERHADLVHRLRHPEELAYIKSIQDNPSLIYNGAAVSPFDSPTHIRAIIHNDPKRGTVIGVRPLNPERLTPTDDTLLQSYNLVYDKTLEDFLKKSEKLSKKPVFVTTGITNNDLDSGIETMSEGYMNRFKKNENLWRIDSSFFKKYLIVNGVPRKIPRR